MNTAQIGRRAPDPALKPAVEPEGDAAFEAWLEDGRRWFRNAPPEWQARAFQRGEQLEREHHARLFQNPKTRAVFNSVFEALMGGSIQ